MRKPLFCLLALQFMLITGCRSQEKHPPAAPVQAATSAATKPAAAVEPLAYTRIADSGSNVVQLQVAVRKFLPARHRGPAVYLVAVMHLGEPEYYHALQKLLDAQTVVLFEGVNPEAHPRRADAGLPGNTNAPPPKVPTAGASPSLQQTMAKSLGLVFQLDAIDYDRTNFFNSDLSVAQLQKILTVETPASASNQAPTARSNPSFDALLQVMDGTSFLGSLFKLGMQFIEASPKLQAMAKLTLIEAVGRLQGDLSDLRNLPPDMKQLIQVLIQTRNRKVLGDLKLALKKIPPADSVAIFYGAGHMHDLERRLTADFNYKPVGETWLSAFSVDLQKNGITPQEAASMRALVQWQLDQMQQK